MNREIEGAFTANSTFPCLCTHNKLEYRRALQGAYIQSRPRLKIHFPRNKAVKHRLFVQGAERGKTLDKPHHERLDIL